MCDLNSIATEREKKRIVQCRGRWSRLKEE